MSDAYSILPPEDGPWGEAFATPTESELERRRFERPASAAARGRAVAGSAVEWLSFNLVPEGFRGLDNETAVFLDRVAGISSASPVLSAEDAQARYGIEGVLDFNEPVTETWAAHRYERARREIFRSDVIARAEAGGPVSDFMLALTVGLVDPVNFLFPFGRVNALRAAAPGLAALEAGEAVLPRMLARGAFGAGEGAIFATALEPAFVGFANLAERDYTYEQSLINIVAAAGVSSVFGFGLGAFSRARHEAAPYDVRAASPEARAAATLGALQAVADGRPVEAAQVHAAVSGQRTAAAQPFAGEPIPHAPVRDADVFAPSGARARALYAIVEIEDLVTSHTDAFQVEPRYPAALQPRDRTRAASEAQMGQFGAPFEPARWGETFQGDAGAPVVGTDGAVESGNARTIWMRRAARAKDPRYAEYVAWLEAQGYPIEGFENPFLVRLTDAARDPAERVRFAEELNKPASALMSAAETAFADARRLSLDTLALHKGGEIAAADNVAFTRDAIARLTSEAERGALIDAGGRLSQAGERRLEAALMAKAYGDPALIEMRFEALDDELKTVGGALADAAPAMARLAARIDAREVSAEFDVRAPLSAATAILREARRRGMSVKTYLKQIVEQGDMFDSGLSPRTLDMLQLLVDNGTRVRARAKIANGLGAFAAAAEASPAPVMFEEARIDYGRALEATGRAAGEPALRARDGAGAEGGGGGSDRGREGAAERLGDERDSVAAELERQLAPRYGDDAGAFARVAANAFANLGAHYGESARQVFDAFGFRIEDAGAAGEARPAGRRYAQGLRSPQERAAWVKANARLRRDANADMWTFDVDGNIAVVRIARKSGLIDIIYDSEPGAPGAGAEAVKLFTNAFNIIGHDIDVHRRPQYRFQAGSEGRARLYEGVIDRHVSGYEVWRQDRLFVLTRLSGAQLRARRREFRAADKRVLQAERQAAAFLAAAECIAREGFSDAGGRGASELLAGLAIGQAAAIPVGVVVSNAAQSNVSPEPLSEEWIRRARLRGARLRWPVSESHEAGPVERWDTGVPSLPPESEGFAPGSHPEGFKVPPAPPDAQAPKREDETQSLIDAFTPFVAYTLEEREDLEAEALMEAFEPLIEEERRHARRRARQARRQGGAS